MKLKALPKIVFAIFAFSSLTACIQDKAPEKSSAQNNTKPLSPPAQTTKTDTEDPQTENKTDSDDWSPADLLTTQDESSAPADQPQSPAQKESADEQTQEAAAVEESPPQAPADTPAEAEKKPSEETQTAEAAPAEAEAPQSFVDKNIPSSSPEEQNPIAGTQGETAPADDPENMITDAVQTPLTEESPSESPSKEIKIAASTKASAPAADPNNWGVQNPSDVSTPSTLDEEQKAAETAQISSGEEKTPPAIPLDESSTITVESPPAEEDTPPAQSKEESKKASISSLLAKANGWYLSSVHDEEALFEFAYNQGQDRLYLKFAHANQVLCSVVPDLLKNSPGKVKLSEVESFMRPDKAFVSIDLSDLTKNMSDSMSDPPTGDSFTFIKTIDLAFKDSFSLEKKNIGYKKTLTSVATSLYFMDSLNEDNKVYFNVDSWSPLQEVKGHFLSVASVESEASKVDTSLECTHEILLPNL